VLQYSVTTITLTGVVRVFFIISKSVVNRNHILKCMRCKTSSQRVYWTTRWYHFYIQRRPLAVACRSRHGRIVITIVPIVYSGYIEA